MRLSLLLVAVVVATPAVAQPPSIRPLVPSPRKEQQQVFGPAPVVPAAARGVHDRAELAAFLDGVMAANLRDKHVAGATVAVVKDGSLFYAKGYGYADVAKRASVDAEHSLFRIGSTSKLFTWTAVMQLVEQGKINLDADVNTYLDFKIPATYPQPITMRSIMTHTPGFEEDGRDLISPALEGRDIPALGNGDNHRICVSFVFVVAAQSRPKFARLCADR